MVLFKQESFWAENMGGEAENPFPPVFLTHDGAWIPVTPAQPACSELVLHLFIALPWDIAGWGTCSSNLLQQSPKGSVSGKSNPLLKKYCAIISPRQKEKY